MRVFGEILGYTGSNAEAVHMYKELGGRELFMRRRILDGGATAWEPRYARAFAVILLEASEC
jgi:hypothetical protein